MWLLPVLLAASACGQDETRGSDLDGSGSLFTPDDRIIGGVESPRHVPFQVLLDIEFPDAPHTLCGGSLLRAEWVLTAAHCLQKIGGPIIDVGKVVVRLGVQDRLNTDSYVQRFVPKKIILRDGFGEMLAARNWTQDIALIQLDRPALLTNVVNTIPLPFSRRNDTFENEVATISGWGQVQDAETGGAQGILRVVNVTVMSHKDCLAVWGPKRVTDEIICTSGEGSKGGCRGDSGGPLYIHDSNRKPMLIGVGSFVYKKCAAGNPTGFIRVTKFLDWIDGIIYNKAEDRQ